MTQQQIDTKTKLSGYGKLEGNPLQLSDIEINIWSPQTQALAKLMDAHFAVFNAHERATRKRDRSKLNRALGTIWNAAKHIRLVA